MESTEAGGNLKPGNTDLSGEFQDGLAVMDEIYEAGEESAESSEEDSDREAAEEANEDSELEEPLLELLEYIQNSVDPDYLSTIDEELVSVPEEFATEAVNYLVSKGTLLFLGKYLLNAGTEEGEKHTVPELLAALGFRLPTRIVSDPRYTTRHFEVALQVAIRYTLSHRRRLPSPRTLDEVAKLIENASNILLITGAGISTSLGIPDFRSDNGLYAQLESLGLADPQEVFDIRMFREDPSIFYSVAAKILPGKVLHNGTPTHKFIKLLHDRNKLLRNYTQNIDNLEHYVGIPHERLVQCHGSFGSAHCVTCGYYVPDGEQLFDTIRKGEIPRCPECAKRQEKGKRRKAQENDSDDEADEFEAMSFGVLKPDITFFGEALPARFDHMLFDEGDAENCDLILCIGTSLRVSPVSEIVKVVPREIPQIYISKTPAKHVTFEVSFLGDADNVIELLCQKLGWTLDHPMAKRPKEMPLDQYPGGKVEDMDGIFRFLPDRPIEEEKVNGNDQPQEDAAADASQVAT